MWAPERFTDAFAASVNVRPVVLQLDVSAAHVATGLYAVLLSVPAAPDAFVQDAAPHDTSPAAHVAAPLAGGVNVAASACSEMRSCLVALASTIFETVTDAAEDVVLPFTSFTANVTPLGTVSRA